VANLMVGEVDHWCGLGFGLSWCELPEGAVWPAWSWTRSAPALMVGTGGAIALLLAARRQAHTERDTGEQRITELYIRAVDQLGAAEARMRLGGVPGMERLAQRLLGLLARTRAACQATATRSGTARNAKSGLCKRA
jgi:hypothetical protein